MEYFLKIRILLLKVIYFLRRENVFNNLNELVCLEQCSPDELEKYRIDKISSLLDDVAIGNDYYKTLLSDHAQDGPLERLERLPIVDKQILVANMETLIDKRIRQIYRSTSGTTGSPFRFPKDVYASGYMDAMMYVVYSWHGIQPCDKQARVWGRAIDFKARLIQMVKDYLLNRRRFSAFEMGDENYLKYYQRLLNFKAKYFYCYPSALYHFALFIEKQGLDGEKLGIRLAICTGEVLFSHYKEKIEEIFGCKVVGEYGSTENGIIAFECSHGKMHVVPTVFLEIIDPDYEGYGRIAVTELNGRSLPFIRYMNGDTGRIVDEACPCGRVYPLLEIREGRIDDYIRCPNGTIVYDAILAYTLKGHVIQFKAYQNKLNSLTVEYLNAEKFSIQKEEMLRKALQKYLGPEMCIIFNKIERIAPERSGKLRYFVPMG